MTFSKRTLVALAALYWSIVSVSPVAAEFFINDRLGMVGGIRSAQSPISQVDAFSIAFGDSNQTTATWSFVSGMQNTGGAVNSGIFGHHNTNLVDATNSFTSGKGHFD